MKKVDGMLLKDLVSWLYNNEFLDGTIIFLNGKSYRAEPVVDDDDASIVFVNDKTPVLLKRVEDDYGSSYCEYADDETVSMNIESSDLCSYLNYSENGYKVEEELNELFEKYGLYLEKANSWFLTSGWL